MLRPSRLHRMMGVQPGRVPRWLASTGTCGGLDAICLSQTAALVAAYLLWKHSAALSIALIAANAAFLVFLRMPFGDVERFARARLRRGECVTCGAKLADNGESPCTMCNVCLRDIGTGGTCR